MPDAIPTEEQVRRAVTQAVTDHLAGADPDDGATTDQGSLGTLAIGADHGGFHLKERLAADLRDRGYTLHDCGTHSTDSVDYPDIAHAVAREVATGAAQAGIVIDGAGIGSAIAANKVPGVRAATCWDISSARNSREHNHANVLALGAGLLGENLARDVMNAWLATALGPDRHARRVAKIGELEQRYGTRLT